MSNHLLELMLACDLFSLILVLPHWVLLYTRLIFKPKQEQTQDYMPEEFTYVPRQNPDGSITWSISINQSK